MKKISIFLSLVLIVSLLAGCAGTPVVYYTECTCPPEAHTNTNSNTNKDNKPAASQPADKPADTTAEALKTGLVISTSVKDSKAASAEDGEGKYDVTMVAVLVDDNGVIRDCIIDGIATSVTFNNKGQITSDLTKAPQTKNELGDKYGMVAWGGAIAEWDEQAAALAEFAIGKTVDEFKSGAVDASGKAPAGSDLASSATIYLGGYVSAIETAVANAQHLGAQTGDELRMATISSISDSTDAGEKDGNAQLYTNVTALTLNNGKITSCAFDAVQAKVAFNTKGEITSDVTAPVQTKNELGDKYGMVAWGGAIAEWNEQAASFAEYVTGKTPAEIAGIAVNEKTAPVDADLAASVTISVGDFQGLIAKAVEGAEEAEYSAPALKTGLAISTSLKDSKSAADEDGEGKYDVTMVAVLVNDNGVIQDCIIDGIATSVKFNNKGKVTSDLSQAPQTKNELGDKYGMVAWGGAIAEWDEQAAALAEFAIGKTVEELKSGAVDASGKAPAGSDLASSATIYLGGYVAAIEAAAANAQHLGAQAGDELRMATITGIDSSADAGAKAEYGNAQLDVDVAVLTLNSGKITSCAFDSVQAKVAFNAMGEITNDVTAAVQTKNELGDKYGMVAWGGAIAEWNEQAASFAEYVTGKTPAEVAGIAVNEKAAPADADLAASVTISVGGFQGLIAKAAQ